MQCCGAKASGPNHMELGGGIPYLQIERALAFRILAKRGRPLVLTQSGDGFYNATW